MGIRFGGLIYSMFKTVKKGDLNKKSKDNNGIGSMIVEIRF